MRYRLGPAEYAEGNPWEGDNVRLSDDVRKCVVFLGWQQPGPIETAPIDPRGTGFFISGGTAFPGHQFLATDRHVAEGLEPPFVIRINKKGGGAGLVHIERREDIEWCVHPDRTVDLAVAPVSVPGWADACAINAAGMHQDLADIADVGAGDPVCVVGLFHLLYGERRNLPVTHVGHVALLPGDEPIPVDGGVCEGYLVQANAISGCSGSPVFAVRQQRLSIAKHEILGMHPKSTMLGVWRSSWKVAGAKIISVGSHDDGDMGGESRAPLGMGVVTPLQKLIDILWSDDMKRASERFRKKEIEKRSATADFLPGEARQTKKSENPSHKEDFNRLLKSAAQKRERED
jgi:hypothetical protein